MSVKSLAEHIVPIALSFYLGSWSDSLGRKPFIFFCMTGSLFASVMNLCNAIFLQEWDRWSGFSFYMPSPDGCGWSQWY